MFVLLQWKTLQIAPVCVCVCVHELLSCHSRFFSHAKNMCVCVLLSVPLSVSLCVCVLCLCVCVCVCVNERERGRERKRDCHALSEMKERRPARGGRESFSSLSAFVI